MARSGSRWVVWSFVLANVLCSLVVAGTAVPVTLEQLSGRADVIVVATVGEQQARFNADETLIMTHTTLYVEQTLAGSPAPILEVSEYGGRVGDVGLAVPGLPRFATDERVLLFLCRDALGWLRTCGATQGRLTVEVTDDGSQRASGVMAGHAIDEDLAGLEQRIRQARAGVAR